MNDDRKNALLMPSIAIVGVLAALLIDIADGPAQKTLGTYLLLGFIILTVLRVVHAS